jgi:hypothetical protein
VHAVTADASYTGHALCAAGVDKVTLTGSPATRPGGGPDTRPAGGRQPSLR